MGDAMGDYGLGGHIPEGTVDRPRRTVRRARHRFEVKVVGLTFRPDYPRSVMLLNDLIVTTHMAQADDTVRPMLNKTWQRVIDVTLTEGQVPIRLEREPDNPHDPYAVQVWVPLLECGSIGYIPASSHGAVNRPLAESMDAGNQWGGYVSRVRIHPDHPTNPGVDIIVERKARVGRG